MKNKPSKFLLSNKIQKRSYPYYDLEENTLNKGKIFHPTLKSNNSNNIIENIIYQVNSIHLTDILNKKYDNNETKNSNLSLKH